MTENQQQKPTVCSDVAVFCRHEGREFVLLVKRGDEPFKDMWLLPGGHVEFGESVEQAAARELREETGISGVKLNQVRAYSEIGRDPRGWFISILHVGVIRDRPIPEPTAGDDAQQAAWFEIRHVDTKNGRFQLTSKFVTVEALAFDHNQMFLLGHVMAHFGEPQ